MAKHEVYKPIVSQDQPARPEISIWNNSLAFMVPLCHRRGSQPSPSPVELIPEEHAQVMRELSSIVNASPVGRESVKMTGEELVDRLIESTSESNEQLEKDTLDSL